MPGQKAKGTKGATVVSVPAKTGTKTSPAAAFADFIIGYEIRVFLEEGA